MNEILSKYKDEVERILAKYPANAKRSAIMPLLYLAQRQQGYVSRRQMDDIAEIVGITGTEVASIAGFYSLYFEEPHGRYHVQICNDLPCAMHGADEFLKQVCAFLGVGVGETTPDGLFTVEAVKCLAACHRAPMFQVQEGDALNFHENQTIELFKTWVADVRQQAAAQQAAQKVGAQ